jgi:hypothetical protein
MRPIGYRFVHFGLRSPQPTEFRSKRLKACSSFRVVRGEIHEHADTPLFCVLPTRRERPRGRRTAEKRDELASLQLIELHSIPFSQGRFAGYRMRRDQSAGIGALAKPRPSSVGGIARHVFEDIRPFR